MQILPMNEPQAMGREISGRHHVTHLTAVRIFQADHDVTLIIHSQATPIVRGRHPSAVTLNLFDHPLAFLPAQADRING